MQYRFIPNRFWHMIMLKHPYGRRRHLYYISSDQLPLGQVHGTTRKIPPLHLHEQSPRTILAPTTAQSCGNAMAARVWWWSGCAGLHYPHTALFHLRVHHLFPVGDNAHTAAISQSMVGVFLGHGLSWALHLQRKVAPRPYGWPYPEHVRHSPAIDGGHSDHQLLSQHPIQRDLSHRRQGQYWKQDRAVSCKRSL